MEDIEYSQFNEDTNRMIAEKKRVLKEGSMEELIKLLPEQYQDIEFEGKLYKGKRDCSLRWNLIKDYIKGGDVVMDLGSSLGYFSHKIAKEKPNCLVVSFESEPEMCAVQKRIFESEGIYNVVVCQHRLTAQDICDWTRYVDFFDTAIALSVLHHFPAGTVAPAIVGLKHLSARLIGEIPDKDESKACGGLAKEQVIKSVERMKTKPLGYTDSHLGHNVRREIWITGWDELTVSPDLDGYFGVSHSDRRRFDLLYFPIGRRWELMARLGDEIEYIKNLTRGLNVWNLLHFNIVWPPPNWWKVQARAAYECLEFKSDIRPWNLLVTSTGLKAIDHTHRYPKGDQAEYKPEHLDRLDEIFEGMEPRKEYLGQW